MAAVHWAIAPSALHWKTCACKLKLFVVFAVGQYVPVLVWSQFGATVTHQTTWVWCVWCYGVGFSSFSPEMEPMPNNHDGASWAPSPGSCSHPWEHQRRALCCHVNSLPNPPIAILLMVQMAKTKDNQSQNELLTQEPAFLRPTNIALSKLERSTDVRLSKTANRIMVVKLNITINRDWNGDETWC